MTTLSVGLDVAAKLALVFWIALQSIRINRIQRQLNILNKKLHGKTNDNHNEE